MVFCFVLISVLQVIHVISGNGPRTESWRVSTFKKQEEKNQLEKNSENKVVKTGELELHLGRIRQRAPRTWSELVPKWQC